MKVFDLISSFIHEWQNGRPTQFSGYVIDYQFILILSKLPKGKVAAMVFGFAIFSYILKLLFPLFNTKYYRFVFKNLSYFILPSLAMFWVGTLYRINEFGFTESRVYLVLGGAFITMASFVLLSKNIGRFLYLSVGLMVLLGVFTYIPVISAKDLGVYSQEHRFQEIGRAHV